VSAADLSRVSFFKVRDYLDLHTPAGLIPRDVALLRAMAEHAMYKDDSYGKVVFQAAVFEAAGMSDPDEHSVIQALAFVTRMSDDTVGRALTVLCEAGLITRNRQGRKNHKADTLSVLPLLTMVASFYTADCGVEPVSRPQIAESSNTANCGVAARARSSSREKELREEENHHQEAGDDDFKPSAEDLSGEGSPGSPSARGAGSSTPACAQHQAKPAPRASSTARSSTARPSREDRGPAEELIARINEVLDRIKWPHLDPALGWRKAAELLGQFSADDVVDGFMWWFYYGDYDGHVYINLETANNPVGILISKLEILVTEWIAFREEHGISDYAAFAVLQDAARAAENAAKEKILELMTEAIVADSNQEALALFSTAYGLYTQHGVYMDFTDLPYIERVNHTVMAAFRYENEDDPAGEEDRKDGILQARAMHQSQQEYERREQVAQAAAEEQERLVQEEKEALTRLEAECQSMAEELVEYCGPNIDDIYQRHRSSGCWRTSVHAWRNMTPDKRLADKHAWLTWRLAESAVDQECTRLREELASILGVSVYGDGGVYDMFLDENKVRRDKETEIRWLQEKVNQLQVRPDDIHNIAGEEQVFASSN
jgi:DNA-binding transcriptional ArsR family regulator